MIDIEGTWDSTYQYPQGPDNIPKTSEDTIVFTQLDGNWIGTSTPQPDGSEITLHLSEDNRVLSGNWKEVTSPEGHYQGREFHGLVQLALSEAGTELHGYWLGPSSSADVVKVGSWTLKKVIEQ